MAIDIPTRLYRAWNAFRNQEPTLSREESSGGYYTRPDRVRFRQGNERSIIASINTKIAVDVAQLNYTHCLVDENDHYLEDCSSQLNDCLKFSANIDQTGRALIQDAIQSMLDEGHVVIVPTDTETFHDGSYDVSSMRVGKVVTWYPKHVSVNLYNENTGKRQDVLLEKSKVAIIENPFYSIMNEQSSTFRRLSHKLALLDVSDEDAASGKLNMIIQLPYVVKAGKRKEKAEERRQDIEMQLTSNKYGIAYIDGTEKITQLNRPLESSLLPQIQYLTETLYSQLGFTQGILDGTADASTMQNYYVRTIEPIATALIEELTRKFVTLDARKDGERVMYFRDPLRSVPPGEMADNADKYIRNEIFTANEIRQSMGSKPSNDPKSDMLSNPNMPHPEQEGMIDPAMAGPAMADPNAVPPDQMM